MLTYILSVGPGDDGEEDDSHAEVSKERRKEWEASIDTQDAGHMWHGRQVFLEHPSSSAVHSCTFSATDQMSSLYLSLTASSVNLCRGRIMVPADWPELLCFQMLIRADVVASKVIFPMQMISSRQTFVL